MSGIEPLGPELGPVASVPSRLRALVSTQTGGLVVAAFAASVGGTALLSLAAPNAEWVALPAHATIEAMGATVALVVAFLTGLGRVSTGDEDAGYWIAGALANMGIADALHATCSPGNAFVWLHGTATLIGGALFCGVWLPARVTSALRRSPFVAAAVAAATVCLGAVVLALPQGLPAMVEDGHFTALAVTMNVAGGAGFLAAALYFSVRHRETDRREDRIFGIQCGLFGAAALAFQATRLWDAGWWFWHVLRFFAYASVLVVVARRYAEGVSAVMAARDRLARRVDLQAAEREATLRVALDALVTADESGVIQAWNPAAERMFGYTEAEVLGRNVALLAPEPHRTAHPSYIRRYRDTEVPHVMGKITRVAGTRRDGTVFPCELSLSEARYDGRRIFVALLRDVTAQVALEEEREERAAALQRSNDALDEFVHITSHDLKEPLRGISNYAGFLGEENRERLDDTGKKYLDRITHLTRRMERLIESLRYTARVGREPMAMQPTDLGEVLGETLDDLREHLAEQKADVRITTRLPTLVCDRHRVGEVFKNLITNGVRYNDKAERRVEVGCEVSEGHPTRFFVRDNGIGIPESSREDAFRIFRRLHRSERFGDGSGMGLAIVKRVVERHGGRVWIESEPGVGSTFFFTLEADHGANASDVHPAG